MTGFVRSLATLAVSATLAVGLGSSVSAQDQPNMNAALNNLRSARAFLVKSTADKNGHRLAAMRYVDAAIREVNLGLVAGRR